MIRHDIVGVRKEKVILIVTGPFPFELQSLHEHQRVLRDIRAHEVPREGIAWDCARNTYPSEAWFTGSVLLWLFMWRRPKGTQATTNPTINGRS